MTPRQAREKVLTLVPHARYMHLSPYADCGHCIDDDRNERYLAYDCESRRIAWVTAWKFLENKSGVSR
jgi:hypothetical protein